MSRIKSGIKHRRELFNLVVGYQLVTTSIQYWADGHPFVIAAITIGFTFVALKIFVGKKDEGDEKGSYKDYWLYWIGVGAFILALSIPLPKLLECIKFGFHLLHN